MTDIVPAAATGLPVAIYHRPFPRFDRAEPIPGLASQHPAPLTPCDRLLIERDDNGVLERLNAL